MRLPEAAPCKTKLLPQNWDFCQSERWGFLRDCLGLRRKGDLLQEEEEERNKGKQVDLEEESNSSSSIITIYFT